MDKSKPVNRLKKPVQFFLSRIPDWIMRTINRVIARKVDDRGFQRIEKFPWAAEVEALYPQIREEVDRLLQHIDAVPTIHDIIPANDDYFSNTDWRQCAFYCYGTPIQDHCELFPKTWEAFQRIPGIVTGSISVLAPGERVPPHTHAYKGLLIYHLAVKIPDTSGRCGLRIAGESHSWYEGKLHVIDPTFEHEVWNETDEPRVILLGEFIRPDLPRYLRFLDTFFLTGYKLVVGKKFVQLSNNLAAKLRQSMASKETAPTA